MPAVSLEIETKYDVEGDLTVPSLTELVSGWAGHDATSWVEGDVAEHRLRATYLDTADLRLAAAGLTLRRRTGGEDAGWHLKVPAPGGGRSEVRVPLGRGTRPVPAPLRRMVQATVRGADLAPVALVETHRTVRRLLDGTGRVMVELADDRVSARRLSPEGTAGSLAAATSWREVEVELVDGDRHLLAAVDEGLRARGLQVATSSSKLARVLDVRLGPAPARRVSRKVAKRSPAGQVLLGHVADLVAQVRTQDLPVRLDHPDSIHKMRVATRRLRSALTTFVPLLDADVVRPTRDGLRWLAGELGAARDAEVLRDRLRLAVHDDEPALLTGSVAGTVAEELDLAYRQAHEQVLTVLDGVRYRRLLTALDALVEQPPLTARAAGQAREVLPPLVARSFRRLRRLVDRAHAAPAGEEREELLHEARKAAKRARYAGEAVTRVFGAPAAGFAEAMEGVQEALGEHQDSVVTRQRLQALALATSSPAAAFTYGRLHAAEEGHAEEAERHFASAWARARKRSTLRWLR